ncbi:PKD domain-containing protein [Tateyamaria omphalii]
MRVTVNAAPIADAGPALVVAPDEDFVLSAHASVDPDGAIASYVWRLPDGTTATQERVDHQIDAPGTYRIGLRVEDNFSGGAAADNDEVFVTVNDAPVAQAGADRLVAPGDPVILDASASFDPDGQIVQYQWTFDDGFADQELAQVERSYATPGTWTAQLVVTDSAGVANSTVSDRITVRVNAAPVADARPDIETDALQVAFDGSGSAGADGDALIYTWDFGDGSPPRTGQQITHVYPRSDTFPVTLQIDDGLGMSNATAIHATTVVVNARPVAEAGGNRAVCSGKSILFDACDSIDPDGGLLLYQWDFGDGTTSDLVNPSKIYETPGASAVTLRIRNGKDTEWGRDMDRVAVLVRKGPIAHAGDDLTVYANQSIRFDGSRSTDRDGAVNAFSRIMGDGGTASGARPEYRFETPGTYTVTLTIQGEAIGNRSPLDTDTAHFTVLPAPSQTIAAQDRAAAGLPAACAAEVQGLDSAQVTDHT